MEIIIRYNGDLRRVFGEIGAGEPEILTEQYAIGNVESAQLNRLRQYTEVEYIELPKSLLLEDIRSLQASCAYTVQNASVGGFDGNGVLIAVLDSGLSYQNPFFKYKNGISRIVSIWDQTDDSGQPPDGYTTGSEYNRDTLTEESSPHTDTIGHGTAVAALALETAPGAELIAVKLASSPEYAFTKTTQVMRAVKYVIEKARSLNQPVVVNISLGTNNGSHSGDSLFETYLDEWARRWRCSMVVAAGNEGVAGRHASGTLTPYERKRVEFQIQGKHTIITLQLWRSFIDPIQVGIASPDGTFSGIQPISPQVYNLNLQGNRISVYYGEPNPYTISVPILMDITAEESITEGIWRLELESLDVTRGSYDIWMSSDTAVRREVFFLEPDENVTVTIPSVTARTISVAAYDAMLGSIADFSGRGYTRGDTMIKPDLAAPGVRIALPEETGIRQLYSGSSMAAPIVSGCCAIMMEWGIIKRNDPEMFGERLKAFLLRGASRDIPQQIFPNRDWGYGKLCLETALVEAEKYRQVLTRQSSCAERIYSEEYLDILYQSETISEITPLLPIINEECGIELYQNQFLVFSKVQELMDPDIIYGSLQLSNVPRLYGITVDQKAVDLTGSSRLAQPPVSLTGSNVIIGIMDTGIEYRHPAFADAFGNSKIISIWDQTQTNGEAPEGYFYGSEYTKAQIEEALAAEDPFAIVPVRDENGHGTYIAGVAAGYSDEEKQFTGAAPGAELIVVKLRPAKQNLKQFYRLSDNDLAFSQTDILQATTYILREARRLNRPVILLYALADSLGPHDGTTGIERYLQRLTYYEGIGIISAAGNEANQGHHMMGSFSGTQKMEKQTVEWNVDGGEEGLCLMVWSRSPDIIRASVTTPRGYDTGELPFRVNEEYRQKPPLEESEIVVSYKINAEGNGDSCIFIRLKKPSPGIWKMELTGEFIINGTYHVWMTLSSWTRPDTRFLSPDPFYTVTMPSTGDGSIGVGGYDIRSNGVYASSGRGPSRSAIVRPDLIAPATGVYGPLGTDSYQVLTGSSAAAALAAGAGAQLMEWGIVRGNRLSMNTSQMRRILVKGAERRNGITYPNNEWGYGLLNVYRSLE